MQKHISLGAIHKRTGEYVYPKIAAKGELYICPECDTELVLCKGPIVAAYFRHKSDQERPCNHYTSPGESQIHKDAKMMLKTALEQKIQLTIKRSCSSCKTVEEFEILEVSETSSIKIEHRFNYKGCAQSADVGYMDNEELVCIFEIKHTHSTESDRRPEPWFEFDATKLIENMNLPNSGQNILTCIRSKKCEMCEEYEHTTDELFVRKSLGQTTVNKNDRQEHLRFNFDAQDDIVDCNKDIISIFNGSDDNNGVFGDYRVIIHSYKGIMRGIIVSKYDYKQFDYWNKCYINEHNLEYPYIEFIDFTGKGTVEIITYLIKKIKDLQLKDKRITSINNCIKIKKQIINENPSSKYNKSIQDDILKLKTEKLLILNDIPYVSKYYNTIYICNIVEIKNRDSSSILLLSLLTRQIKYNKRWYSLSDSILVKAVQEWILTGKISIIK